MSGLDLPDGTQVRKGAGSAVLAWLEAAGVELTLRACGTPGRARPMPSPVGRHTARRRDEGRGSDAAVVLGVIHLKDIVKDGLRERFDELRAMGIRTVMITGDNPLTAKAIAAEAGVDDYPRRGDARRQARPHPTGAGGRQPRRDDGRRHERRARTRPGRRRRRDEHRHVGGEGGRQHGRPRLRPDEAYRHRPHRQAAADHARRADDLLARQRHREVLRDHPGDVHGRVPGSRGAEHHAAALTGIRRHERDHLQRDRHRRPHPARAARREIPRRRAPRRS